MQTRFAHPWHTWREWWEKSIAPAVDKIAATGQPPAPDSQSLGLVLGGGGGKGAAHLGVLAVLEELDVPLDLIVGSSIGGAVGVLYAAGVSLDAIEQAFRDTALRRIFARDPTRTGLIGPRKRQDVLTKLLEDRTFADLRIPCAVMAADLISGEEIVIDQGPLVPALMATTAVPGIFPPITLDGRLLSDGSVLNDLPVDVAKRLGARQFIAVELSYASPLDGLDAIGGIPINPLLRLVVAPRQAAVASRALDLVLAQSNRLRLAQHPPALLLRPEVRHIPTLDMTRSDEGRRAGEAAARSAATELLSLREWRLLPPEPERISPLRRFGRRSRPPQWPGVPWRSEAPGG